MTVIVPPGTWDTHVHVFDPVRFPYVPKRSYTPGAATLDVLRARHDSWGVEHCVLVQPSVYGTDNACMLDALTRLGPGARAVAVVDANEVTDATLADLASAGVAGLRVNLVSGGGGGDFAATAARLRGSNLFLQIYAPLRDILAQRSIIEQAGVPVVLDHFAGSDGAEDVSDLLSLCGAAAVWIKLSADYRLSADTRAAELIGRFWSALPDRLIWGSDWPHTGGGAARKATSPTEIEPFRKVYSLSVPHLLADAGLSDKDRARILASNPARLMGLDQTNIPKMVTT